MYGANVIIFEGILAFYSQEVRAVSFPNPNNEFDEFIMLLEPKMFYSTLAPGHLLFC